MTDRLNKMIQGQALGNAVLPAIKAAASTPEDYMLLCTGVLAVIGGSLAKRIGPRDASEVINNVKDAVLISAVDPEQPTGTH